jgi:hypothetical protein
MWNYLLSLATVGLAGLQLAKDWGAHQTSWRRAAVLFLILLLGAGGAINTYYSGKRTAALRAEEQGKANRQHNEDQKQIAGLQKAVETATTVQESNTKQFLLSFTGLSKELNKLQAQVKTEGLQKEAAQLRAQLEATQKALTQKAEVVSTLGPLESLNETLENLGTKELSLHREPDGTLAFKVFVIDKSDVQAKSGSVFLRVCIECAFAEEPERFHKVIGAPDTEREMIFEAISAKSLIVVPLKVKAPTFPRRIEVSVSVRCETCTVRPRDLMYINY